MTMHALNDSNMNVYPGGKQPDGLWEGNVQKVTLPNGTPKGMKMVMQEHGVDVKGMNAAKMREKLNVTGFGKTLRMGSTLDSRNARF